MGSCYIRDFPPGGGGGGAVFIEGWGGLPPIKIDDGGTKVI